VQRNHEPGQIVIVFRLPERCDSGNGAIATFCNRDIFTISKYGDAALKACEAAIVSDPRLSFPGRIHRIFVVRIALSLPLPLGGGGERGGRPR